MSEWPVQVRFGGLGGQGLITLGAVLAEAGVRSGMQVAASQSYGSRARGGVTRADVILSDCEIDFPHVLHPDLLIILAQEAYDMYMPDVAPGGLVMVDDFFVNPMEKEGVRQLAIPGTASAVEEIGNKLAANFVMLGAMIGFTGMVVASEIVAAAGSLVNPRFIQINLEAFDLGFSLGKSLVASEAPWR